MRKKVALILSLAVMLMALMPANVFATDDKGMENVLKIVKDRITVPANYTQFSYGVNTYDGKTTWEFNWSLKNGSGDEGSINVSADASGNIISYNHYVPYDYNQKKLPKLDRQTARTKAEEFLKRVYPDVSSKVKYVESNQYSGINTDYYFNYQRVENGIPVPENNVYINVNSNSGEVSSYYCNWTDGLTFPDAGKAISMDTAQKAYQDKLGLRLVYSWNHDRDNPKVFAEYVPKYYSNYFIDALTGDRVLLSGLYYAGGMGGYYDFEKKMDQTAAAPAQLTPEELKAIEEVSKLISQDGAEKIARDFKELGLTSDYKLTNAGLSKDWEYGKGYTWNLSFTKENADNKKDVSYIGISINAITGEIKGFNRYYPHDANETAVYDENASKAAVDSFLKEFKADKYSSLEYDDNFNKNIYLVKMGKEAPTHYDFTYYRTVNGVRFTDNAINIGFDAINGKVTNFYMSWYDMTFPPVDKVVPLDKVYQKLFSDIGLELQYRFDYTQDTGNDSIKMPDTAIKPKVKLVYAVKPDKPLSFDANTGDIIDGSGQPYKESKPPVYTDIEGNFAEQKISILAANGIYLEGKEFKPNDKITQVDFMRLLAKTLDYYSVFSNDSKEIDEMYRYLIRSGIIKENEKAPNANVSRLDAAKFIVRAMKYDKVADIKGIFKCSFKDADKIGEDNIGYVAIVQGLKIMNGYGGSQPYFLPDGKLTRAEAAVVIYNYLQR